MVKFHLGSVQDLRLWVGRFANTGTHVLWSKHGINVGKRPCRRWHQPMSKTVTICRFPFLFINFLVDFLWKGHIKIAKSSVLLQQNCYFVCRDLLAKVSQFLFFSSSTKFATFVEDLACEGLRHTAAYMYFQSFGKSCLQSLCVQLP